jgi:arginase family enzyme
MKMLQPGMVAVTAIPFDEYSSYMRGPAEAPLRIWEAFHSNAANTFAEDGADIVEFNPRRDIQDMTAMVAAKFFREIAAAMLREEGKGKLKIEKNSHEGAPFRIRKSDAAV